MDNSFDFTPGTKVSYSSTNFVTAGLILINHGKVYTLYTPL